MFFIPGKHDIVTDDRRIEEELGVVAGCRVEAAARLHPVVAFIAHEKIDAVTAKDEVITITAEHFRVVDADKDDVLASSAHDDIHAVRIGDYVVAFITLHKVAGIARVSDDIVACAAIDEIDPSTAFDAVVACVAPDTVVAEIGNDGIVAYGAADHGMFTTSEAKIVSCSTALIDAGVSDTFVNIGSGQIVTLDLTETKSGHDRIVPDWVVADLVCLVDLEDEIVIGKDVDA
ncbi:hypothetical protein D3C78_862770 [compost metagenome]